MQLFMNSWIVTGFSRLNPLFQDHWSGYSPRNFCGNVSYFIFWTVLTSPIFYLFIFLKLCINFINHLFSVFSMRTFLLTEMFMSSIIISEACYWRSIFVNYLSITHTNRYCFGLKREHGDAIDVYCVLWLFTVTYMVSWGINSHTAFLHNSLLFILHKHCRISQAITGFGVQSSYYVKWLPHKKIQYYAFNPKWDYESKHTVQLMCVADQNASFQHLWSSVCSIHA